MTGSWELKEGRAGGRRLPSSCRRHTPRPGSPTPVCASVTATATAHFVLPSAPTTAPPALPALARDAQHGLLVAVGAARALLAPQLRPRWPRRRRAKPAPPLPADAVAAGAAQPAAAAAAAAAATAAATALPARARAAQQFLAGGVAGAVSKTLVAPLERITTLVMVPSQHQRYSLGQAVRHAWGEGGLRGLYRGHAATLLKIFPASAIQFAVFNGLKEHMLAARAAQQPPHHQQAHQQQQQQQQPGELANLERLAAGAAAGAAAACVCYPLESLRTAMSVAGGMRGSLPQAARAVVAAHGLAGLYRGFRASLLGDVLGNALGFTCYEVGNRLYHDAHGGRPAPPHLRGVIGACSAACVLTLTMPLEVVRRRLQVQGLAGRPVLYRGTLDCLHQVLRTEGIGGFYAASVPTYLKVPASIGVMYFCFELLMSWNPTPAAAAAAQPGPAAARS